jgi:integrase
MTGRATIGEWLTTWLEQYIKPSRAPRTYTNYHQAVNNYVPEYIRRVPLSKLPETTETFDALFTHVRKENGGRTAENLRTVLRASFNVAKKKKRIDANPIVDTEPVDYDRAEMPTFTAEQALRVLDASKDDRLGALFVITLSLGLREGEAAGLKAEDIDLDNRMIHVRRSLQWSKLPDDDKGCWIERPPKAKSRRDLPFTDTIFRAIVRHMARRQEEAAKTKCWKDSGYFFTSTTGAPLHARNILEAFHHLCDAAKVPRVRVHDTRHSCATFLHLQGASAFTIQEVLGHSQLSTTKRYTHVPVEVTRAAVTGVESLLESKRKKPEQDSEPKEEAAQPVRIQ